MAVESGHDDATRAAINGGAGSPLAHDSAHLHVTGEAHYTDDIVEPGDTLHAALGISPIAHGTLKKVDLSAVKAAPGVVAVITADDIPGVNNYGPVLEDDPIFTAEEVQYAGQPLFAVAATSAAAARRAVALADLEIEARPAILRADEAAQQESFVLPTRTVRVGDSSAALAASPHQIRSRLLLGGQDQFYLEGQIALAIPRDNGDILLHASTQHPSEVQHTVARALGKHSHSVMVECRRMGGAFGGKESQPALIAAVAALLASRTGQAVKLRLDRDVDMIVTGKRHDFVIDECIGFDDEGRLQAVEFTYAARCGMSADLSGAINDRTLFHSDNAYFLPNATFVSQRCKTHTVSNTAFRGFGGPQGMFAIEYAIDDIARHLGLDPLVVRQRNFYGTEDNNVTPYGQVVADNIIHDIVEQLLTTSDYYARRHAIKTWNETQPVLRRGIALTPVKFGISFTTTHLNQAGALIHVYHDGSVYLNHGGTEMGQGLYTKVAQVVAEELQIDVEQIKISAADTAKVPNTSATAASSGSDINGKAAQAAARKIKRRLTRFAAEHFGIDEQQIVFANNKVHAGEQSLAFSELVELAYLARTSLSATGFYATPKIHFDTEAFSGRPFYYYAYGAAVSEVVVDTLTGEHRLTRVDILHDCGKSLNPALDRGQVEGGFVQGAGWLTSEELWWNDAGQLQTHAPSTYKIPVCSDVPDDFRVTLLESDGNREDTIYRSKAVGEPPLMLALSVFFAIRDAIATADNPRPALHAPATPEAVLRACGGMS